MSKNTKNFIEDELRNCHSDIKLNMSVNTLCQLRMMLSCAEKFTRLIDGENSTEHLIAKHWSSQLFNAYTKFEKTFSSDNSETIECVMHTFFR